MTGKVKDITGKVFDNLIVISFNSLQGKIAYWNCVCKCGKETVKGRDFLSRKFFKSCGCVDRKGQKRKQTYDCYGSWVNMKSRCKEKRPDSKSFKNYSSRGVTYCEEWEYFDNFLTDMGERPEGCTLDRIDNDKGYYKENCRWADKNTQSWNKRPVKGTTSKYNGVSLHKDGKYRAYYSIEGKQYHVGYYKDEIYAAIQRDKVILNLEYRVALLGESIKYYLNFPELLEEDHVSI